MDCREVPGLGYRFGFETPKVSIDRQHSAVWGTVSISIEDNHRFPMALQ